MDLDFDLLVTDLSPMDLLIQRLGRLHRHYGRSRPAKLKNAVCYVLRADGDDFESGSEKIYGKYLLMRTKALLALLPEKITLPDDISQLVQNTYDEDDAAMVSLDAKEYNKARKEWNDLMKDKEARAKTFQIFGPVESQKKRLNTIVGLLDMDIKDSSEKRGEAAVRDGADSIEVIVVQKIGGVMRFLPWIENGREISHDHAPDDDLARTLAGCRVRLPSELDVKWRIDETIKCLEKVSIDWLLKEWQKSRWLKRELFLVFDETFKINLCGCQLEYDRHAGLSS